ncbi:MAG: hypothetical protein HY301_11905 [Verrucomicrobia bacterium]|nr:hypothetical protein [Verrucomicrobiota bacterium]
MFVLAVLFLVGGYFALTSSTFFCTYVLPRVGQALHAEISATGADISPFSSATLRGVKFRFNGQPPLVEVGEVKVRFQLKPLFSRRLEVDEVTLSKPSFHFVVKADGTDNLGSRSAPAPTPAAKSPATTNVVAPPQVVIKNVTVSGGLVEYFQQDARGGQKHYTASEINFSLDRIENGKPARLHLATLLDIIQRPPGDAVDARPLELKAKFSTEFELDLSPALAPRGFKTTASAEVTEAAGELADLSALTARLDFALTQDGLRKFDLVFDQRGVRLGQVTALGTFDFAKSEGRVEFSIPSLDRKVFNLFGAARGLDFERSTFSADAVVHLSRRGQAIASQGRVKGRALSVRQRGAGTPPVDLDLSYEIKSSLPDSNLTLDAFKLSVKKEGKELLTGGIDFPLGFSWGKGKPTSFTRSNLRLELNDLNLAEWRALAGPTNLAGRLAGSLVLSATPETKQLSLNSHARLDDFALDALRQSRLDAQFAGNYSVAADTHALAGKLTVANPAGAPGDLVPRTLQFDGHLDLAEKADVLQLRSASIAIKNNREPAGTVDLNGHHDRVTQKGAFSFKLTALNQHALRPFTTAAFPDRTVVAAALDGNADLRYEPKTGATLGAELALTNLVVSDLADARRSQPFAAALRLDAASLNGLHELKEFTLALPPTDRATNRLALTGRADFRVADASEASLKISADALDLTSVMDLLDVKTPPAAPAKSAPGTPSPGPAPTEPAAVKLPVKSFTGELAIGKLFLRHIAVSNWAALVVAKDNVVTVKPFTLSLNGAPAKLSGTFNLGVRGWTYDTEISADRVPLQPLADSFAPETPGRYRGDLLLNTVIKGAGLTGTSLRQNLTGEIGLSLMNAEIKPSSERFQRYVLTLSKFLRIPELGTSPVNWAGAQLKLGNGRIDLAQSRVASDAFVANLTGSVPIADVFADSPLDLPVHIELRRALAQKARLISPGSADAPYAALPDFAKLSGTLANPTTKFEAAALAGLGFNAVVGVVENAVGTDLAGTAGQVVKGLTGLVTGKPPVLETNVITAEVITNRPAKFNPVDFFRKKK